VWGTLYAEFEDPKKYREAVQTVRTARAGADRPQIFVRPPRIFKMGEEWTCSRCDPARRTATWFGITITCVIRGRPAGW